MRRNIDHQCIEPAAAWGHAAVRALAEFTAAEPSERTEVLSRIAGELGLNPLTLRRAIAGWRFVLKLNSEHPDLARHLAAYPVAAIEHLARWHRRDAMGALKAATGLIAGQFTVRSLAAAERKDRLSRADGLSTERGRARESIFRARLADAIRLHLEGRGPDGVLEPQRQPFAPPLDLVINRFWGVIIVGPYRNSDFYSARATDWCLRALGCAQVSRLSILMVVPGPEYLGYYLGFMRHHGISEGHISVVGCKEDASAEDLWNAISPIIR